MPGSRKDGTLSSMTCSLRLPKLVRPFAARITLALVVMTCATHAGDRATIQGTPHWTDGWFTELFAGVGIVPGGDITLDGVRYEADYKSGVLLGGVVGRAWTPQFTTKLEWFYRSNSVKSLVAGTTRIAGGDLASTNAFVTATYRFGPPLEVWGIAPFAGLGAGLMQEVDVDLDGLGGEEFSARGRFAYLWLIGLERTIGARSRVFLEGRAVAAGSQELDSSTRARRLSVDYDTWGIIAGLRWSF
jgi:hypothetical protein